MITLPILTTSLIHFSFKGWENVLFELVSERVKNASRSSIALTTDSPRERTLKSVSPVSE